MLTAFQNLLFDCALAFDLPILDWIQANLQSGFMDKFMPFITVFGDAGIFWPTALEEFKLLTPENWLERASRRFNLGDSICALAKTADCVRS